MQRHTNPFSAVNLGQGFPNWKSPTFVKEACKRAVDEDFNQYARAAGQPLLCQTVASRYSQELARTVDWEKEVAVGVGASETLYACMQALINPGDEVVMLSPAFDIYSAQVGKGSGRRAGKEEH